MQKSTISTDVLYYTSRINVARKIWYYCFVQEQRETKFCDFITMPETEFMPYYNTWRSWCFSKISNHRKYHKYTKTINCNLTWHSGCNIPETVGASSGLALFHCHKLSPIENFYYPAYSCKQSKNVLGSLVRKFCGGFLWLRKNN